MEPTCPSPSPNITTQTLIRKAAHRHRMRYTTSGSELIVEPNTTGNRATETSFTVVSNINQANLISPNFVR